MTESFGSDFIGNEVSEHYLRVSVSGAPPTSACIMCWNYLYLSQKLGETDDLDSREALLHAVANGSVVSWQHINLLGEYDFSDDKLQDSVEIKPPKLAT